MFSPRSHVKGLRNRDLGEHVSRSAKTDSFAIVQQQHLVANICGHVQIVGDAADGLAPLGHVPQLAEDDGLVVDVQGAGGFVQVG